eukprot:764055-Hanusia_phi.AAC.4
MKGRRNKYDQRMPDVCIEDELEFYLFDPLIRSAKSSQQVSDVSYSGKFTSTTSGALEGR